MENPEMPAFNASDKMVLYQAAQELLHASFSHPQVVTKLIDAFELHKMEDVESILGQIIDKAVNDRWENLEEIVRAGLAKGVPFFEIKENLYALEEDREVVDFIADSFYGLKTVEIDAAAEERTLKAEGSLGMLKYGAGAAVLFFVSSNLYLKWLWAGVFILSFMLWLSGFIAGRRAKKINQFFNHESDSGAV